MLAHRAPPARLDEERDRHRPISVCCGTGLSPNPAGTACSQAPIENQTEQLRLITSASPTDRRPCNRTPQEIPKERDCRKARKAKTTQPRARPAIGERENGRERCRASQLRGSEPKPAIGVQKATSPGLAGLQPVVPHGIEGNPGIMVRQRRDREAAAGSRPSQRRNTGRPPPRDRPPGSADGFWPDPGRCHRADRACIASPAAAIKQETDHLLQKAAFPSQYHTRLTGDKNLAAATGRHSLFHRFARTWSAWSGAWPELVRAVDCLYSSLLIGKRAIITDPGEKGDQASPPHSCMICSSSLDRARVAKSRTLTTVPSGEITDWRPTQIRSGTMPSPAQSASSGSPESATRKASQRDLSPSPLTIL